MSAFVKACSRKRSTADAAAADDDANDDDANDEADDGEEKLARIGCDEFDYD
jgi:hypothetical protein